MMRFYSTRSKTEFTGFAKAALTGLAPDGGLYIPEVIPQFSNAVRSSLGTMSYAEIAFETIKPWVLDDIPSAVLEEIVYSAYPFGAPLISAAGRRVLELFHGPTAAFKDFGARFMARAFSYLRRGEGQPLTILTATSGDTGGAVADGFYGAEGISVTVLYPRGRISELQERQIAGLGKNISAVAVEGSFDDCQRLVKEAFVDQELKKRLVLASANSINVARLIPQIVYYAAAAGRASAGIIDQDCEATPRVNGGALRGGGPTAEGGSGGFAQQSRSGGGDLTPIVFSVPSGNFGNLTAGLHAYKMGAPIAHFIAATNANKTVPDYLESGSYRARPSKATLSNAMDVGAPSNFERMAAHFSLEEMRRLLTGISVSDAQTLETISQVFADGYCLDPHSAVGWKAAQMLEQPGKLAGANAIIVSTAHPAKFSEALGAIGKYVPVPPSLQKVMERRIVTTTIPAELNALKNVLL